jgi:hypothetical protein
MITWDLDLYTNEMRVWESDPIRKNIIRMRPWESDTWTENTRIRTWESDPWDEIMGISPMNELFGIKP